jgi:hypothetical protein
LQIELTGQLLDIGVIDDEALGEGESAQKRGIPVAGAPLVLISSISPIISRTYASNDPFKLSLLWRLCFIPHSHSR